MYRIERDRSRFREIVRGRLRQDLRKYLSTSELLGRRGDHAVSIPVPQIELPRFHFGENKKGGVGQGPGDKGDPVGGEAKEGDGAGAAGEHEGTHILAVASSSSPTSSRAATSSSSARADASPASAARDRSRCGTSGALLKTLCDARSRRASGIRPIRTWSRSPTTSASACARAVRCPTAPP
jgi:hypothetical protein